MWKNVSEKMKARSYKYLFYIGIISGATIKDNENTENNKNGLHHFVAFRKISGRLRCEVYIFLF